ncbi:MAG: prefoldin subunit alpha [Candidatus Nanoarchaeia archaeon]
MKELQQKYVEYQTYEEHLKDLQKQLQQVDENILEINYIKNSLDEFSQIKEGKEILCPLSSGIFVKANIRKTHEFFVNVGSNVVVGKDLEETKKLMESQEKEIEKTRENLNQKYYEVYTRLQNLQQELSRMVD